MATNTGETLQGVVKEVGANFTFIQCDEVKVLYGKDVFCPAAAIISNGLGTGSPVEFELLINAKGQPQAGNVRPAGGVAQPGIVPAFSAKGKGGGKGSGMIILPSGKSGSPLVQPVSGFVAPVVQPSGGFQQGGQKGGGGGKGNSQLTGDTLTGVLKEMGQKFAFIGNEDVRQTFGCDVFCPAQACINLQFSLGDSIDFELMVNAKGQPQAANARKSAAPGGAWSQGVVIQPPAKTQYASWAQPGADSWALPQVTWAQPTAAYGPAKGKGKGKGTKQTGQTLCGPIKEVGSNFCFISCEQTMAEMGKDVFCPAAAVAGYNLGDMVEFELMYNAKGQPQASNVRPSTGAAVVYAAPVAGGCSGEDLTGQSLSGHIADVGENFAFIDCPSVKALYGKDVFCPASALRGCTVGEEIAFELMINAKGQPQAANARKAHGQAQASGGGKGNQDPYAKGGYHALW